MNYVPVFWYASTLLCGQTVAEPNVPSNVVAMQTTTPGMLAAAGVFLAAYRGSVRQLRYLPLNRGAGVESGRSAGKGSRRIQSFSDFIQVAGPSILLHGQGLAVGTVFSGLACGAVDGLYAPEADAGARGSNL